MWAAPGATVPLGFTGVRCFPQVRGAAFGLRGLLLKTQAGAVRQEWKSRQAQLWVQRQRGAKLVEQRAGDEMQSFKGEINQMYN